MAFRSSWKMWSTRLAHKFASDMCHALKSIEIAFSQKPGVPLLAVTFFLILFMKKDFPEPQSPSNAMERGGATLSSQIRPAKAWASDSMFSLSSVWTNSGR